MHAAQAARAAGIGIIMGGPNLVKGGSHSGNVSAAELARRDLLDIMSSDYVPSSLIQSAFLLRDQLGWSLPKAANTVARNPAQAIGLADRGEIAPGKRADLHPRQGMRTACRWCAAAGAKASGRSEFAASSAHESAARMLC